jgi:phosphoribosylcarboxyaminoimidazole (NCAIR) mutase
MPPGIPVGTMAIGKPGARNAAWFAAAILAAADDRVTQAIEAGRQHMADGVLKDDEEARSQA